MTDKLSDELKTVLKAERPDGTPVEIAIVRIAHNLTEVGVRTGVVGVWDKRVSEQIQKSIGQKLSSNPQTESGYTADTDKKKIDSLIEETKPSPQAAAIKESDETSVSNILTDLSADNKNPMVVQKPPKIQSEFVIYFGEDTNELSEIAVEKLNSIAEVVIKEPVKEVRVSGFSDSIGTSPFKKMISESRANSVRIYLIGKGIHPSMITSKGFGSDRPVASNKNEEGRRLNRRVEIELIYQ